MRLTDAMRIRPKLLWHIGSDYIRDHEVTVVLCVSRFVFLQKFFAAFEKLTLPKETCHLLIFLNADNPILKDYLRVSMLRYSSAFASVSVYQAKRHASIELIDHKQQRFDHTKLPVIYAMQRDIMDILKTRRFVMFEDDTLMPSNSIVKLLRILATHKKCAVATGIETSRAMFRHQAVRLGVHIITRNRNRIVARVSLPPHLTGLQHVDACGWYCVASYRNIWKRALIDMLSYVRDVPSFGMDNVHTNNIQIAGYEILADFSLWCRHLQASMGKTIEWGKEHAVPQVDLWIPHFEVYAEGLKIQWQNKFFPKKR